MHIGERIRHGRMRAGLSLRALAEKIGITAPALGNYENGITAPDSSRLIAIAETLTKGNFLPDGDCDERLEKWREPEKIT